jgi:hypothetical protein
MQQQVPPPSLAALQATVEEHGAAIRSQLESAWKQAAGTLETSFSKLARAVLERAETLLGQERDAGRWLGRSETLATLLAAVRRMQAAESRREWASALADVAATFAGTVAVLWVRGEQLEVIAARDANAERQQALYGVRVNLTSAPAFRSALQSADPVISQCSARELSAEFARAVGAADDARAWLLPVRAAESTMAVLYASGPQVEEAGLELAATVAGWVTAGRRFPADEVLPTPGPPAPPRELPDWSRLSREDQELHLRAQRFARVQVAEIRLHHDQAVRAGRAQRNLYRALKREIDQAREAFRQQFVEASPTMVDYLHRELVRTLANEDAALLGEDYPGPLV